jgi:hypothetical protein
MYITLVPVVLYAPSCTELQQATGAHLGFGEPGFYGAPNTLIE